MRFVGNIPGRAGRWTVEIEGRSIKSIDPAPAAADKQDGTGSDDALWLAPGFFDMQVNGYIGHSFSQQGLQVEQVEAAVQALWATGTALVFPTITTASPERLLEVCRTLRQTMDRSSSPVAASIAGLHLEGPYISAEDGPRGAHNRNDVRPPSWDEFQQLQEAAGGAIRLITLAPELPGALDFIAKAVAQGVVVALGHTGAQPADIAAAIAAGASLSTHLGNGAHAMLPRHPNYIWEQLAADELWAGLIPDGHHLPPAVLKAMIRAKGTHRCILTTDAAGITGMPPGKYKAKGQDIELFPGGPVRLSGTPFLAGSALRLNDGLANAMRFAGIGVAAAVDMVTYNPALLFRLEQRTGRLRTGMEANLTAFRLDSAGNMHVVKTIVQGNVVYAA